jgi:hypothetical protein
VAFTVPARVTGTAQVTLAWSAADEGAGVRGCDLEVSAADDGGADDGGSWTRLPTDTQAGGYVYAAAPGQEGTVTFPDYVGCE